MSLFSETLNALCAGDWGVVGGLKLLFKNFLPQEGELLVEVGTRVYTVTPELSSSCISGSPAKVGIEYTRVQPHVYIRGSGAKIQVPTC